MSGLAALTGWCLQSTSSVDQEIDEEFEFHVDCRTRELVQAGWTPELARTEAEREFGQREHWRTKCREAHLGPRRWLLPLVSLSVLIPLVAYIAWLSFQLQMSRNHTAVLLAQQERLKQLLAAAPDAGNEERLLAADAERQDLTGEVRDASDKPVAKANIVVIHKSWPNNRYRQDSLRTSTDETGTFRLPKLFVPGTQVAFLVTILADGHAMQSEYVLKKAGEEVSPFKFKLKPALKKTLTVKNSSGMPLANTVVFPTTRRVPESTKEYMIYYQSAADCGLKTDANGNVQMSFFELGDEIDLGVMTKPDSAEVTFNVNGDAEQVVTLTSGK